MTYGRAPSDERATLEAFAAVSHGLTFFTTRREHGGTGLGLRIARSLIEAQQGTIEHIPSGRGATFLLTLPTSSPSRF